MQNKEDTINDLIDRQQVHLMDEVIEEKIEEKCSSSEKVNIERCKDLYNEVKTSRSTSIILFSMKQEIDCSFVFLPEFPLIFRKSVGLGI